MRVVDIQDTTITASASENAIGHLTAEYFQPDFLCASKNNTAFVKRMQRQALRQHSDFQPRHDSNDGLQRAKHTDNREDWSRTRLSQRALSKSLVKELCQRALSKSLGKVPHNMRPHHCTSYEWLRQVA